jgi:hypothetical protein
MSEDKTKTEAAAVAASNSLGHCRNEVPAGLKSEISRIIKDAFDCGFNAHTEAALQHSDAFALADAALERYWPSAKAEAQKGNE